MTQKNIKLCGMETCNECQSNKMSRRLGKKKYECDRQVIQKK